MINLNIITDKRYPGNHGELYANELYVAHLAACGLVGILPEEPHASCNWEKIYYLAGWNSITGLTWHAARRLTSLPGKLREQWEQSANQTAMRRLQYEAEREAIIDALLERGVSVAKLKGASLERLYPHYDMRSVADNDLLYGYVVKDERDQWHAEGEDGLREGARQRAYIQVNAVMEKLGYIHEHYGSLSETNDSRYVKPPCLCFEMHHALIGNKPEDIIDLGDPWPMCRICDESPKGALGHLFEMTWEAEYLYCIAHAYKHPGAGVRFLADLWLMRTARKAGTDWELVDNMLKDFGLSGYERRMRHLAEAVFGELPLSEDDVATLAHMVEGGSFGSGKDRVLHDVNRFVMRGNVHPRLAYISELLSPDRGQPTDRLKLLAHQKVTRMVFPAIKLVWLMGKTARQPKEMFSKISALLFDARCCESSSRNDCDGQMS